MTPPPAIGMRIVCQRYNTQHQQQRVLWLNGRVLDGLYGAFCFLNITMPPPLGSCWLVLARVRTPIGRLTRYIPWPRAPGRSNQRLTDRADWCTRVTVVAALSNVGTRLSITII
ncbi:hypothetical protein CBL_05318 [Carabus blaptoides fortunei]